MKHKFVSALVFVQFALLMGLSFLFKDNSWDDGAITVAFARTFALDGKIALNGASDQVEGFSSISWFLLNSLFMWWKPSFPTMLLVSRILSILSICGTTFVLDRLCRAFKLSNSVHFALLCSFVLWGGCFSEAVNGMEMGLLALSGSLITLGFLHRYPVLSPLMIGAIVVFIATRFEAAFYMVFMAFPLLFERRVRDFVRSGVIAVVAFSFISVFRYIEFLDVLPNTLWAKAHPPYFKRGFEAISSHFKGFIEFPIFFGLPLLIMILDRNLSINRLALGESYKRIAYLLFPIIGAVAFSLLIGLNLGLGGGYHGRMQLFVVPHALVLMGVIIDRVNFAPSSGGARGLIIGSFAAATITSIFVAFPFHNLSVVLNNNDFDVTPKSYRETGEIVDLVRQKGALPVITFLSPDVGGLGLCCDNIRVIDLALLTNARLAKKGYGALPELLATERPHLIEAHQIWAKVSNLYDIPIFKNEYRTAFIGNTRFYIQNEFANQLIAKNEACIAFLSPELLRHVMLMHRYVKHESNEDIFEFIKKDHVVVLSTEKWCQAS